MRDGLTVLAGSRVVEGPYGDLFYRAVLAAGVVIGGIYATHVGYMPQIDPAHTVEPPRLREGLDRSAGYFADAIEGRPPGTWTGRFPDTLGQLSLRFGFDHPLIAAAAARAHRAG